MHPLEEIALSTLRLFGHGPEGTVVGTSFCIGIPMGGNLSLNLLVTNKHVVENADNLSVIVTVAKRGAFEPDYGRKHQINVLGQREAWTFHPNPDVDLAAMPTGFIHRALKARGEEAYLTGLSTDWFAPTELIDSLSPVENILMVGYPSGLADNRNNLPIMRRGITASNPRIDFDERPEFVIDCASFPGSSGSPVFLHDSPVFLDGPSRTVMGGERTRLLGVLWGGPQYTETGAVEIAPVPTSEKKLVSRTNIPINLGYCIKVRELMWFVETFKRWAAEGRDVPQPTAPWDLDRA